MSSKYPYIDQSYQHLLNNSSVQQNSYHYGQPVYIQQQQYPQPQQIVFLPGHQQYPANNFQQARYNHDSYAADQPNPRQNPSFNPQSDFYSTKQHAKVTPQQSKELIHKVQYGDTLQGLSLIYDIPISKIKQRNNIQSDSIYYLKEIVIPNPKSEPLQQAKTQAFLIEQFITYMPFEQKSQKVARYYLQENQWHVDNAVKAFKQDLQWERKNKVKISSVPVHNQYVPYSETELKIKKQF